MNGIEHFKLAISKYADFSGRSRRSEYWYFVLFYFLILMAVTFAEGFLFNTAFTYVVGFLFFIIPYFAVAVRRLHDIGKSGWYYFLIVIPLVGSILMLIWLCTDSQYGLNKWGPNPKGEGNGQPGSSDLHGDLSRHLIADDLAEKSF